MSQLSRATNKPSIQDVARLAGVSAQTVSRVARDAPNVKESTKTRVLLAMDQLKYVPNRAARALRSGQYSTLGVITQNLGRTGESLITAGIAAEAEERGYSVSLRQISHPGTEELTQAGSYFSHHTVDGLIVVQAGSATIPHSLSHGTPTVVSDSRFINNFSSAVTDQVQGTRLVVEHLLNLGHTRIAHIAGPTESPSANIRQTVWQSTLEEAGLPLGPIMYGNWSAQSGYKAALALAEKSHVTAIFAANDEMAFGAMRALYEKGVRLPADISIAGFDDIALAEYSVLPLTTVRQDFETIGRTLTDLVIARIAAPTAPIEQRVIPSELIVRASTGPRPTA
ncbi:LacI family DNA-binding transcriptional regulator [Trueperella pyogenes]|uniref:LacI family DNA-binding transcriptional regulator n=1 Tax=Trueperella pyogenes TaxID=1661 RepID=UPI00324A5CB3